MLIFLVLGDNMYNKKIMISNIINSITSTTEMNFQHAFVSFLDIVCKYKNLRFEKVQPSNGDAKNDGWIPEKNIYFAMYSPSDPNISQIKSINKKLKDDLDGLCEHIYINGEWGKDIKEFYLIINTHDKDMPADPHRILEETVKSIKEKYKKDFKVNILAANEIKSFLIEAEYDLIEKISNNLDIYEINKEFSVPDVMTFIDDYVDFLTTTKIQCLDSSYSRIKVDDKIKLNDLSERKNRIINLIDASDKIDKYLEFINSEGLDISKYEKIKNYIVQKYYELVENYSSKELYDRLVDELIYDSMNYSQTIILEAAVVNVFIKCDIFRKE